MSGRPLRVAASEMAAHFVNGLCLNQSGRMDQMKAIATSIVIPIAAGIALLGAAAGGQTSGEKESFTAIAVVNNNLGSGAGTVLIDVTRWSTEAEAKKLVDTLREKGPTELLDELRDQRPTGTIRTPDSLAYDLRFAQQVPTAEGGRRIVLATDRPMGFWEVSRRPPTIDYPFTVIQMEINRDGEGKGTLSYATKITAMHNIIELENFATSPVMLTEIRATKSHR